MPPSIYCEQCNRNPVQRLGDLCPECKRQAERAQQRRDHDEKELERLERKPHNWREALR